MSTSSSDTTTDGPTDDPVVRDDLVDVVAAVDDRFDEHLAALEELVRIPSISAAGNDPDQVRASAAAAADLLRDAGVDDVRMLEVEGAHPYVTGSLLQAGPDAPTLLLYAHHDVQPVGTPERWTSPAFAPQRRDGRLYGRGASDDKAGVVAHVAAIRAWLDTRGSLPINLKVVFEGEEEIGSPHLATFLDTYGDELDADVLVIADVGNFRVGWPGLTWALRGLMAAKMTVRTMAQPVHSGVWGGVVPDALTATCRLVASLHDDRGRIAVEGFDADRRELSDRERAMVEALPMDAATVHADARTVDGLELVGGDEVGLLERNWFRPTITPIGMSAPHLAQASNTLLSEITTVLSCRMAPDQDPDDALEALRRHAEAHVPWGAEVTVELRESAPAWVTDPSSPAHEAAEAAFSAGYGHEVAWLGAGGSIPFVDVFSRAFGGAAALLLGFGDPSSNAHGEDESQHIGDLRNAMASLAILFQELADRGDAVKARGA